MDEEKEFPVSGYRTLDKLLDNLNNIKPLNTKYMDNLFIDLLTDLVKNERERSKCREEMFKTCRVISLHKGSYEQEHKTNMIVLGTIWDIIVLIDLQINKSFFL